MGDYEALAATAEKVVRENYSYLCIRQPEVDKALASLAEGAANVSTDMEFHELLNSSLSVIPDPHLRIISSDGRGRSAFNREQKSNYSRGRVIPYLEGITQSGPLIWGSIGDVFYLAAESASRSFEDDYKRFCEQPSPKHDAVIVDLRSNGGGSDTLTSAITSTLMGNGERTVSQYIRERTSKSDPLALSDFEPFHVEYNKSLRRRVVVLVGAQTLSAGEDMALDMAAIPGTVVIGDRTGGGSGCPQRYLLDGPHAGLNIGQNRGLDDATFALDIPSWLKYRKDKVLLEGNGVIPDIVIPTDQTFVNGNDKVLERAIELLTT